MLLHNPSAVVRLFKCSDGALKLQANKSQWESIHRCYQTCKCNAITSLKYPARSNPGGNISAVGFVLRSPGHREVISDIDSVTLSVMLTCATISPEGGERTDTVASLRNQRASSRERWHRRRELEGGECSMLRCEETIARELTGFCCAFEKNEGAAERRKVRKAFLYS